MLARLGHVFLILGLLLAGLVVLIGLGFIAWNLWNDGRSVLEAISNDAWSAVFDWLLIQGVIYFVTALLAGGVMLVAIAISYVLGGFSELGPDFLRKNSTDIISCSVGMILAFIVLLVAWVVL